MKIDIGKPGDIKSMMTPFMLLNSSLSGGIAIGRWLEIVGAEGLGKTTLGLQIASGVLETFENSYMLICDAEQSLDYSRIPDVFLQENVTFDDEEGTIYIDGKERGLLRRPDNYEEVEEIIEKFATGCQENNLHGVFVWDSLIMGTSEKHQAGGTLKVGYRAQAIQDIINRFNSVFLKTPIDMIVINQIRDKVTTSMFSSNKGDGTMSHQDYHVSGGHAHKFFSVQTFNLYKSSVWKYPTTTPRIIGTEVRLDPTKNKLGVPNREVKMVLPYELGYSDVITNLNYLNDGKYNKGNGFSSLKFPEMGMEKGLKLEKFCETLVDDEKFRKDYVNMVFSTYMKDFKLHNKLKRFNSDLMSRFTYLDAKRVCNYFENYESNDSIDDFFDSDVVEEVTENE